jgi:alpha-N-arabinofuranosidase
MVTVQRSNDIYGPYELCPRNPILSHRDRGGHPIQAVGHADMVEDQNGVWWMVCHGIRPLSWAMLHNLGRETFLSPVQWVDGWPVVGNNGGIELEMAAALPSASEPANWNVRADFSKPLDTRWNYIRNPDMTRYRTGNGVLSIIGSEQTLSSSNGNPVFMGMRQQAFTVEATAVLKAPGTGRAGMSAFYNNDYHYDLYVERTIDGSLDVVFNRHIHDLEAETFRQKITGSGEIQLRIKADREYYTLSYRCTNDSSEWIETGKGLCAGLCTETTHTMTFTGVYLGIFASFGTAEFLEWNLRVE